MSGAIDETDREWFRRKIPAYCIGALDDPADAERFAALLGTDEACREMYAPFAPSADALPANGHIPASLLTSWTRSRAEIRGFERALIAGHLQDCAECREDLRRMQWDPDAEIANLRAAASAGGPSPSAPHADWARSTELPLRAAEAPGPRAGAPVPRAPQAPLHRPDEPPRGVGRWSGWGGRAVAAWAVAATVLLVVAAGALFNQPRDGGLREAAGPGETALAPAFRIHLTRRGIEAPGLPIPPGTRTVVLAIPDRPENAEPGSIRVRVTSRNGEVLVDSPWDEAVVPKSPVLVLNARAEALAPGDYDLRFEWRDRATGEQQTQVLPFRFVHFTEP